MLTYTLTESEKGLEIILDGDLDFESTEFFKDELMPSLKDYKELNINFEHIHFVDSSGIGLLIELVQYLQNRGAEVTIANVNENVTEVFDLLQIPDILGEKVFI